MLIHRRQSSAAFESCAGFAFSILSHYLLSNFICGFLITNSSIYRNSDAFLRNTAVFYFLIMSKYIFNLSEDQFSGPSDGVYPAPVDHLVHPVRQVSALRLFIAHDGVADIDTALQSSWRPAFVRWGFCAQARRSIESLCSVLL